VHTAAISLMLAVGVAVTTDGAPEKVERPNIGWLAMTSPPSDEKVRDVFWRALGEFGWTEGRNVGAHYRYTEGRTERLPALVRELVALRVAVIVTAGSPAVRAAKSVTLTTPIVVMTSGDPVGEGLVASLARPGGNVTGLTLLTPELGGKRLQQLRETLPSLRMVAVLWNPDNEKQHLPRLKELQLAARELGVDIHPVAARRAEEFRDAFEAALRKRAAALLTLSDAPILVRQSNSGRASHTIPAPGAIPRTGFCGLRGLMAYGPVLTENWRRSAWYVHRILTGVKTGDLPIEQPTKFELVMNLKVAKALGLTIPQTLLLRADQVID